MYYIVRCEPRLHTQYEVSCARMVSTGSDTDYLLSHVLEQVLNMMYEVLYRWIVVRVNYYNQVLYHNHYIAARCGVRRNTRRDSLRTCVVPVVVIWPTRWLHSVGSIRAISPEYGSMGFDPRSWNWCMSSWYRMCTGVSRVRSWLFDI